MQTRQRAAAYLFCCPLAGYFWGCRLHKRKFVGVKLRHLAYANANFEMLKKRSLNRQWLC